VRVEFSRLETTPPATIRWVRDAYDNSAAIATFSAPAWRLEIASRVVVQQHNETPLDFLVADYAVQYPFTYDYDTYAVLQPFMVCQPQTDLAVLRTWVESFWKPGEAVQTYGLLARLCLGIKRTFFYQVREEPGVQTVGETLSRGIGSCRDFANLLMEAARYLGLAARFVSGYLYVPAADARSGATHAWTEIYLPGAGWKGFDPTSGDVAGSEHIAVAVARLPESVSPVTGSFFGPVGAELEVGVWVRAAE